MSAAAAPGTSLVSVIIPGFNCSAFIAATLDSALAQSYARIEVLFVDDGSADATEAVVSGFAPRVRCLRGPGRGAAAARNAGIAAASGDLLAFLDHDDLWAPDKIARQVAVLDRAADAGLVFTLARLAGDSRLPPVLPRPGSWERGFDDRGVCRGTAADGLLLLLLDNLAPISSLVVRRSALPPGREPFRPDLLLAEDYELVLAIASRHRIACLPEPLTTYHLGPQGLSARAADMQIEALAVFREYLPLLPPELAVKRRRDLVGREAWLLHEVGYGRIHEGRREEARRWLWAAWKKDPRSLRPLLHLAATLLPGGRRGLGDNDRAWP